MDVVARLIYIGCYLCEPAIKYCNLGFSQPHPSSYGRRAFDAGKSAWNLRPEADPGPGLSVELNLKSGSGSKVLAVQ